MTDPVQPSCDDRGAGGVYPGCGMRVGREGAIPGTHPALLQGPILVIFQPQGPTYGQMKGFSRFPMRFLRYGSRIDPELTQNDPRYDPPDQVPRWSPDTLRSPYPGPQISYGQYKALFDVLLTVAQL